MGGVPVVARASLPRARRRLPDGRPVAVGSTMSDASLIGPALAARLRAARRDADLTQDEVARDLGIARTSLVALEKGERRVKPDELISLARLYGRTVDELLRPSAPVEEL